jgi:hypothetical protein
MGLFIWCVESWRGDEIGNPALQTNKQCGDEKISKIKRISFTPA